MVRPEIVEKKLMEEKIIFRGNLNLNLLYRDESGEIRTWEEELPFSQFDQMDEAVSGEGAVNIDILVTELELDPLDQRLHLKCSMAAQYLVEEETMVELVQDAYGIHREVKILEDSITLQVILEQRTDGIAAEQIVTGKRGQILDATFAPDFPKYQSKI